MRKVCSTLLLTALLPFMTAFAGQKPKVAVLATGGTIAGYSADPTSAVSYTAAVVSVQDLLKSVKGLSAIADCECVQVFQVASENMDHSHWFFLRQKLLTKLADPTIAGCVVTHGTDTMEETAFFLHLTLKTDKPVVLVGSMRPASSISPDGPQNLLNAIRVAMDKKTVGKGVLVMMNDTIWSARNVQKNDTIHSDAFQGGSFGPVGLIAGSRIEYLFQPLRKHTQESEFNDLGDLKTLPRVDIIYCYAGVPPGLLDQSIQSGAKGIVLACVGDGSLSDNLSVKVKELTAKGIPIVRSTRIIGGPVVYNGSVSDIEHRTICAGTLTPQKSMILLQLCLVKQYSYEDIIRVFEVY